jgi:hypothetical protein
MFQGLFNSISFLWVEYQHFTQKIKRYGIRLGVETLPALLVPFRQFPNIFSCKIVTDKGHIFLSWCSQNSDGSLDLVQVIVAWEKWSSTYKLRKNAPD